MVVNKPSGMVVHPSPGHWESGTLVNALLHHWQLPPISAEAVSSGTAQATPIGSVHAGAVPRPMLRAMTEILPWTPAATARLQSFKHFQASIFWQKEKGKEKEKEKKKAGCLCRDPNDIRMDFGW